MGGGAAECGTTVDEIAAKAKEEAAYKKLDNTGGTQLDEDIPF